MDVGGALDAGWEPIWYCGIMASPGGATQYYGLSADNRWLYYTHVTSESDIWMLTLNEERE